MKRKMNISFFIDELSSYKAVYIPVIFIPIFTIVALPLSHRGCSSLLEIIIFLSPSKFLVAIIVISLLLSGAFLYRGKIFLAGGYFFLALLVFACRVTVVHGVLGGNETHTVEIDSTEVKSHLRLSEESKIMRQVKID